MSKYWPGTHTIVDPVVPSAYTGQQETETVELPDAPARTRIAGRGKGTGNKLDTDAKRTLDYVFALIGGPEAMADWAAEHRTEFYTSYIRARVPKPIEAPTDDANVTIIIQPRAEPPRLLDASAPLPAQPGQTGGTLPDNQTGPVG